jgi:hypothetical protein
VSNSDKPLKDAVDDLERVLSALSEELASWRRRALRAESGHAEGSGPPEDILDKVAGLESDNQVLNDRVVTARERVDGLLTRLHFLEEQVTGD